jgi:methylated-DNA-[protein]-cysteine S-methyltransferase
MTHGIGAAQSHSKSMRWAIFETDWGTASLASTPHGVSRFWWPTKGPDTLMRTIQSEGLEGSPETSLLPDLQQEIQSYFAGVGAAFSCTFDLDGLPPFVQKVLSACAHIGYGQIETYGGLAARVGNPRAARAVGAALGRNPIPLLIPCHRIVRSDGGLGGFGAEGGVILKRSLLAMEGLSELRAA